MASISSLSGSSSTSSIYGNRNVISGLASGLDTETLIENAVSGYKKKIQGIQQKQTQVQWQQDAYRSILDKMITLNRKYTSYTSNTNLFSQSFFNKAVKTSVLGKNADAISATGRTNSNVVINGVKQLATSSKYTSDIAGIGILSGAAGTLQGDRLITQGVGTLDLNGEVDLGTLSGGMTLTYGDSSVYLGFSEKDVYKTAEEMAEGIREKLGEAFVRTGSGDYVKASDRINVEVSASGEISFSDKSSGKNSVYISSADKGIQSALGISEPGKDTNSFKVDPDTLWKKQDMSTYLSDKSLSVNYNGASKQISLKGFKEKVDKEWDRQLTEWQKNNPDKTITDEEKARMRESITKSTFKDMVQEGLDKAFGKDKVKMELLDATDENGKAVNRLSFEVSKGDTLSVTSEASKPLGLGSEGLTSFLKTSTKLKDLMKFDYMTAADVDPKEIAESQDEIGKNGKKYVVNSEGRLVDKDGVEQVKKKKLTVNGKEFEFGEDTTIESLMTRINGDKDAGVNISYSKLTNQFSISATETGTSGSIDIKGELAKVFGLTEDGKVEVNGSEVELTDPAASGLYSAGQDAIFNVTVNGSEIEMTRSSNVVDFDGMSVTLKDTFGYDEAGNVVKGESVRFETEADTDKLVEAIKSFVDDYNAMVTEIRQQYSTMPAEKSSSNHTRYLPLTDEDKEGMSESAIEAYEEKAKQGILFGETELSSLHSALRNAITGISTDVGSSHTESAEFTRLMQRIGISTKYTNGLTTLDLDTDKLRDAISSDPDSVRNFFTQTKENGAEFDGIMQRVQKVVNQYANTSSGSPGILVQRAGSQYAPTSVNNNALQSLYNRYTEQIEKLQNTMADRIDYYTRQFTALEQMMMQMNSQSSTLAGLMGGGGSGY